MVECCWHSACRHTCKTHSSWCVSFSTWPNCVWDSRSFVAVSEDVNAWMSFRDAGFVECSRVRTVGRQCWGLWSDLPSSQHNTWQWWLTVTWLCRHKSLSFAVSPTGTYISDSCDQSVTTVVQSFVTTRLDYCNSVQFSNSLLCRLQSVQNVASRLVTGSWHRDHVTPVLWQLHCLTTYWVQGDVAGV